MQSRSVPLVSSFGLGAQSQTHSARCPAVISWTALQRCDQEIPINHFMMYMTLQVVQSACEMLLQPQVQAGNGVSFRFYQPETPVFTCPQKFYFHSTDSETKRSVVSHEDLKRQSAFASAKTNLASPVCLLTHCHIRVTITGQLGSYETPSNQVRSLPHIEHIACMVSVEFERNFIFKFVGRFSLRAAFENKSALIYFSISTFIIKINN